MDFFIDLPTQYVDADAPIQGIAIESDNFSSSVVPTLEVCASTLAKSLLVRDPAVYSPWYVMPPFNALWHHIPLVRRAFLGALPVYNVAVRHMDVMPEQMLMDPVNQRILPESMWAQEVVATWGGSDDKSAKIVRDWRFAKGRLANFIPVCLNFKGEWVRMDRYSVDYFKAAW